MDNISVLALPKYRYVATIIDGAIIFMFNLPLMLLEGIWTKQTSIGFLFLFIFRALIYLLFDVVIPLLTKGQTIGRVLIKLRVVRNDYQVATAKNFFLRASIFIGISAISDLLVLPTIAYICWMLVFMISIYWLYSDSQRRTIHDRVAHTLVVNDRLYEKKVS